MLDNTPLLYTTWTTDSNGNKISTSITNEQHQVVNGRFLLDELPNEFNHVKITSMNEVHKNQVITSASLFKVNYVTGIVSFHISKEAQIINVNYYGRGQVYIDKARIVTENDGTTILQTLDELTDLTQEATASTITATKNANTATGLTNQAITSANTATNIINNTNIDMRVMEIYNPVKAYKPLNKVTLQGSTYINILACTGISPTLVSNNANWLLMAQNGVGFVHNGDWNGITTYHNNTTHIDMVYYNGASYYSKTDNNLNKIPTEDTISWGINSRSGSDGFSSMISAKFTATSNSTTHIIHGIVNYDPTHDKLKVFGGLYDSELDNTNYTLNGDLLSIDLVGWNISIGDVIRFELYKNLNDANIQDLIDESIVTKNNLDVSIASGQLGNASELTTTSKVIVGAINENTDKIGILTSLDTQNKTNLVSAINENTTGLVNMTNIDKPNGTDDTSKLESKAPVIALGVGVYNVSTLSVPVQAHIYGHGCADALFTSALSDVVSESLTADAISIPIGGTLVEKISVRNTASGHPTSGCGIHVPTGGGSNGNGVRINDVSVKGFYDNVRIDNGAEWFSRGLFSYDPVRYGLFYQNTMLPDGGDFCLSDFSIIAGSGDTSPNLTPKSGFRWESGGGAKITNGKINSRGSAMFDVGLDFCLAPNSSTVDLLISNTSIENYRYSAIKISTQDATSQISRILITGCQFQNNVNARCIYIPPNAFNASAYNVSSLAITGNVFGSTMGALSCIDLDGVKNVSISGNVFDTLYRDDTPIIKLGSATKGITLGMNNFRQDNPGTSCVLFSTSQKSSDMVGDFDGSFMWSLPSITNNSTWVNVWAFDVMPYNGIKVDFTVVAMVEGIGVGMAIQSRLCLNTGAGINVALIGTDIPIGYGSDIQWTHAGNTIFIQMKMNTGASGSLIDGYSKIQISGLPNTLRVYN